MNFFFQFSRHVRGPQEISSFCFPKNFKNVTAFLTSVSPFWELSMYYINLALGRFQWPALCSWLEHQGTLFLLNCGHFQRKADKKLHKFETKIFPKMTIVRSQKVVTFKWRRPSMCMNAACIYCSISSTIFLTYSSLFHSGRLQKGHRPRLNPIPKGLWYDIITRAWAIMAHVNLKSFLSTKQPLNA